MIRIKETVDAPRGTLDFKIYRRGVLIEHVRDHNLVVNGGRNDLALLIAGDNDASPLKYIAFGSGIIPAELTDTALVEPSCRIPFDRYVVDGNDVTFYWTLDKEHGNGINIAEFALIAENDRMITHYVRGRVIGKDRDIVIQGTYTLHF